jgi:hypothetical protein
MPWYSARSWRWVWTSCIMTPGWGKPEYEGQRLPHCCSPIPVVRGLSWDWTMVLWVGDCRQLSVWTVSQRIDTEISYYLCVYRRQVDNRVRPTPQQLHNPDSPIIISEVTRRSRNSDPNSKNNSVRKTSQHSSVFCTLASPPPPPFPQQLAGIAQSV